MECRKIQEYFSAYLDGELPKAQAELVARHLEVCPLCQQEHQVWQRLWDVLAAEPVPAPPDITARMLARLPVNRPQSWWRHLALAASLLIGIFLGGRLGFDLHHTTVPNQTETMQLAWEGFEATPAHSLDAMLASNELDNGSGR